MVVIQPPESTYMSRPNQHTGISELLVARASDSPPTGPGEAESAARGGLNF
jgi:hypothetical protein